MRIDRVENHSFFEPAILNEFYFQNFFFASFLFKSVTIYGIPRMRQNFDDYPDFQQKAKSIKNYEKHCKMAAI